MDIWCWDTLGEALFFSKNGLRVYSWRLCTKDNGVDESIKSQTKRRISVQTHESFIPDFSVQEEKSQINADALIYREMLRSRLQVSATTNESSNQAGFQ